MNADRVCSDCLDERIENGLARTGWRPDTDHYRTLIAAAAEWDATHDGDYASPDVTADGQGTGRCARCGELGGDIYPIEEVTR